MTAYAAICDEGNLHKIAYRRVAQRIGFECARCAHGGGQSKRGRSGILAPVGEFIVVVFVGVWFVAAFACMAVLPLACAILSTQSAFGLAVLPTLKALVANADCGQQPRLPRRCQT